jgi:hypothetical protein
MVTVPIYLQQGTLESQQISADGFTITTVSEGATILNAPRLSGQAMNAGKELLPAQNGSAWKIGVIGLGNNQLLANGVEILVDVLVTDPHLNKVMLTLTDVQGSTPQGTPVPIVAQPSLPFLAARYGAVLRNRETPPYVRAVASRALADLLASQAATAWTERDTLDPSFERLLGVLGTSVLQAIRPAAESTLDPRVTDAIDAWLKKNQTTLDLLKPMGSSLPIDILGCRLFDVSPDDTLNVFDYRLLANMYLGLQSCTASIGTGLCQISDVQLEINAINAFINGESCPSPTGHEAILTWTASTTPNIIGGNVYRSETDGGPYTKINSTLVVGTRYVDQTVVAGHTYYYVVTAVAVNEMESDYSNQAKADLSNLARLETPAPRTLARSFRRAA